MATGLTFNVFGKDVSASDALKGIPGVAGKAGADAGTGFSKSFDTKFGDFDEIKTSLAQIPSDADRAGGKAGAGFGDAFEGEVSKGFGDLKSKMGDLVGGLGLAATVGTALKGAWDNNNNQFKLQAALGLSPAQAKADAESAATIYAGAWGDSLDDVDAALGAVRKSLGNLGKGKLESLTTQGLAFQQVFGIETTESINAVSQMLRTGLAKNAQEAFDILVAGEQSGTDKAGDLIDTFNEYGTQFRKVGLDGKTALGILQQGLQGGARDADIVADAIKEFSLRTLGSVEQMDSKGVPHLTALGQAMVNVIPHGTTEKAYALQEAIAKGGKGASAALQTVLDGLRSFKDPVDQAQTATALFGTQAEDLGAALYDLDPASAASAKGLSKVEGAGKKLTDTIGKTTSPLEAMKRAAMATLADLGKNLLPVLKPVLGVLSKMGPELAAVAAGFAAFYAFGKISAVITGISAAVSALAVKLGLQTAATEAATVAQTELDVAMDANPIGLVVAAIAALVAGFVLAWKHSETFRKVVKGALNGVKTAALFLWDHVLKPIFEAWKFQFRLVATVMRGAWDNVIHPVFTGIKTAAQFVWGILKGIFEAWKMQWRILSAVFKAVWDNGIHPVISGFASVWRTTWDVVQTVYEKIKDGIRTVRDVIKAVVGVIKSVWSGIGSGLQAVWDNSLGPVFDAIRSAVGWIIDRVEDVISKVKWVRDNMPDLNPFNNPVFEDVHWDPKAGKLVKNAMGTGHFGGGSTWVGERGPELVNLPRGSQVIPHSSAMSQAGRGGGGSTTIHITLNGIAATKADVGRAVGSALEAAANSGSKWRIGKAVVV